MNEKLKLLIYVLIAALVIAGAYIAYQLLLKDNAPEGVTENKDPDSDSQPVEFFVEDSSGNIVNFSDKRGKPVVINFWATWCPYCVQEMPDFEEMYKKYGDKVEFMMIDAVDGYQETRKMGEDFIKEKGYTFPVYYDTKMSAAYTFGVTSLPVTYFADENGNIVAYTKGKASADIIEKGINMILEAKQ